MTDKPASFTEKQLACVRQVANLSVAKNNMRFDSKKFDKTAFLKHIKTYSPKIVALLEKIEELDKADRKKNGRVYKHLIFSDLDKGSGDKLVASALVASGFKCVYGHTKTKLFMDENVLNSDSEHKFALMSGAPVFGIKIGPTFKKSILSTFNQRPHNVYGEKCRFLILDKNFREGVDGFDIKYVHILEPQTSRANEKQVIGRATRTCGQNGLYFTPNQGWPLYVYIYDTELTESAQEKYKIKTMHDLFLTGFDLRQFAFAKELDKYAIVSSVDYSLNKNVHNFKVEDDPVVFDLFEQTAALTKTIVKSVAKSRTKTMTKTKMITEQPSETTVGGDSHHERAVNCKGTCGKSPTGSVPATVADMILAWMSLGRVIAKTRKERLREYLCSAMKKDAVYCDRVNQVFEDVGGFVEENKVIIGHMLPNLDEDHKRLVAKFVAKVPTKPVMPFVLKQAIVGANYSQYAWPKAKIENLCIKKDGAKAFSFMPTQEFVRHYFTPSSPEKGLLLYHSVGTGKCMARDTPILMYDGSVKKVQDIRVGDVVMGDDSGPRHVTSLGSGEDDMYEIASAKGGDPYTVNSEHILCFRCDDTHPSLVPFTKDDGVVEMEVNEYLALPDEAKRRLKGYRVGVDFVPRIVHNDPYEVGRRSQAHEPIPDEYKTNDRGTRLRVLAGIIDTYGTFNTNSSGYDVVVDRALPRQVLLDNVKFLARSLGFVAYGTAFKNTMSIHGSRLHEIPVRCARNDVVGHRIPPPFPDELATEVRIEPVGRGDYYGFTIDGNNRFLLGDFTVTHNTCTAIATATTGFEKEGYTVLWVTRASLKSDYWKNQFDQVCNTDLQKRIAQGNPLPPDLPERKRLLSKSWRLPPMSYRQFTNLISKKNRKLYDELTAINGHTDPLRKTLLIIDEAHKLYGGDDLAAQERPNTPKLLEMIRHSYKTSGADSVKVLLMTATPFTNDPMELVKLLNVLREDPLPDKFDDFAEVYLNADGTFSKKGKVAFMNEIAGYVSYLNRELDARQFAQPQLHTVLVPMSRRESSVLTNKELTQKYKKLAEAYKDEERAGQEEKKELSKKIKVIEASIKGLPKCTGIKDKTEKQACKDDAASKKEALSDDKKGVAAEKKEIDKRIGEIAKKKKALAAEKKKESVVLKNDFSQEKVLAEKCKVL